VDSSRITSLGIWKFFSLAVTAVSSRSKTVYLE
jgi:hypothetical protein